MSTENAAREPVVLALHSSAASGRQWRALVAGLDHTHRVVAPDLHGHGDGPAAPLWPAAIVRADTDYIVRHVMASPTGVHLVGHSYGAALALRVARRCGAQVRSLSIVEPVAFGLLFERYGRRRPAAEVYELGRAMHTFVRAGHADLAAQRFVTYWGGESSWARLSPDARAAVAARMGAVAGHFDGLAADDFTLDDCRAIETPTLLLAGAATRKPALRVAELCASALPNVRDERLPGGNHVEALESPARIVQRIAAFVREHDARTLKEAA
jgi:pimeloyl-ACP methyl ester carboxylesterase